MDNEIMKMSFINDSHEEYFKNLQEANITIKQNDGYTLFIDNTNNIEFAQIIGPYGQERNQFLIEYMFYYPVVLEAFSDYTGNVGFNYNEALKFIYHMKTNVSIESIDSIYQGAEKMNGYVRLSQLLFFDDGYPETKLFINDEIMSAKHNRHVLDYLIDKLYIGV